MGWSSLVARLAHNQEATGSNPVPATMANRLYFEIVKSRLPLRQRFHVRGRWVANGRVAFHSEQYRDRKDAENLVEALKGE